MQNQQMTLGEITLRFTSDGGYIVAYEQNGNWVEGSGNTIDEALHRLSMKLGMRTTVDSDPFEFNNE